MRERDQETLIQFLMRHVQEGQASFHMPGHKGSALFRRFGYGPVLEKLVDLDITEITGADNLFLHERVLGDLMERYAALYGAKQAFLLVNGSSAGLQAAIGATVGPGETLLMARNCHKAIWNGVSLAGGQCAYLYPETIAGWDLAGEVTPEAVAAAMEARPEAKVVLVTSPNYYGVCSDIVAIAQVVHHRDGILIVDQAHGAHLFLTDPGLAAEKAGADLVVTSTHKTLASFTQSAILLVCSDRVSVPLLEDWLQMLQSTSPSYLLMASLDMNEALLYQYGKSLAAEWNENVAQFYEAAEEIPGLRILTHPWLDRTKLNLDASALGLDGPALEAALLDKGIFLELTSGNLAMALTGIGNEAADYQLLAESLRDIAAQAASRQDAAAQAVSASGASPGTASACNTGQRTAPASGAFAASGSNDSATFRALYDKVRLQRPVPRNRIAVPWQEAAGKVCAAPLIPYPPGIPLVCPGEVMDQESLAFVARRREAGQKIMGMDPEGRVVVGR